MKTTIAQPIRFGIVIGGLLIAYFLILSLLGWNTNPIFSLFNAVITSFGIYETIKIYKLKKGSSFNYINGFKIGLVAGVVGAFVFTSFFAIYITELNPSFYEQITANLKMKISPGLMIFSVLLMGIVTSIVLTLSFMQLFKRSNNITAK